MNTHKFFDTFHSETHHRYGSVHSAEMDRISYLIAVNRATSKYGVFAGHEENDDIIITTLADDVGYGDAVICFGHAIANEAEQIKEYKREHGIGEYILTEQDCEQVQHVSEYAGKFVAINHWEIDWLEESAHYQIARVLKVGGIGDTVHVERLCDKKHMEIDPDHILGVVPVSQIPNSLRTSLPKEKWQHHKKKTR